MNKQSRAVFEYIRAPVDEKTKYGHLPANRGLFQASADIIYCGSIL